MNTTAPRAPKSKMSKLVKAVIIAIITSIIGPAIIALINRTRERSANVTPSIDTQSKPTIQQTNHSGPNQVGVFNSNNTQNGK